MSFSLFPSLFDHPPRIRFLEQEEDEHIELMVRQHWVTNLGWIVMSVILIFLPLFFPTLSKMINLSVILQIPLNISLGLLVLWYLLIAAYMIENYVYWYFNIYIITNRHLVDIALQSLLARNITEARLDDVQSARSYMAGIWQSLFNFGDVIIETAAEKQNIQFLAIPRPDVVSDRIQDLQELQEEKGHGN